MPFVAVSAEQRQVDTAANGSLTPAIPSGTISSDMVLAIGLRETQQPNTGYTMTWGISSGWTLLTQIIAVRAGATSSGRLHLAVWAARGESAPTISWTSTTQTDNGRIGDIAVCATYRPSGDLVDDLASDTDATTGTTDAYTFDSTDAGWAAGIHAFTPNSAAVSFVSAEGFTEAARFDGPDNLRPALVLTERRTATAGATYNAPTFGSPLAASQIIVGGFGIGGGIFVDGAVH